MAQFEVPAGTGWVLLGTVWAADVLNLRVKGLESGVHLSVVLAEVAGSLVSPHEPQGVRALLGLGQARECRHIDARARRPGGPGGSGVTRRTLKDRKTTLP